MPGISLLSSYLLGSALAKAISTFLVQSIGINLFTSSSIPALSEGLAQSKTFDLLDFILTVVFTVTNFLFLNKFINSRNKLINLSSLIFNFILFLQINFASYNLLHVLVFLSVFHSSLIIASKIKLNDDFNPHIFANGLLVGFFLLLLINQFTSTILPLAALTLTPVFFLLFKDRLKFLPNLGRLLPIIFIFLIIYNPLYYIGHFDSVEEGFWLGWLSGIRDGKVLYRDIAAYHPPIIVWLLYIFQKIIGFGIENTRLLLHLLQIVGMIFYYFSIKRLLKNRLSVFVVMLLALSLTSILVKNNVEVRLSVGLLSLAMIGNPLIAGALAAVSLFTSIEVGIAAIISAVIGTTLVNKKNIIKFLGGFLTVAAPIAIVLAMQGALLPMLTQIGFYASAFSSGYLNLPVSRSVNSAFIHWHIINQYVSEYPFLWEIARGGVVAGLILSILKKNKLAISLAVFALILFRSALGRSDIYHLLFPLLVAIPLIFSALEKFKNKYLVPVFSIFLVFVFGRNIVNANFIEAKLFQLQTYGKVIGEQEKILTDDEERVVQYIKENTLVNETIFVYPWNPEIYFLAERPSVTKFYTPYAFFTEQYQKQMISELEANEEVLIIYNPEMKFANLTPDSLPVLNKYLLENYKAIASLGQFSVLTK